MARDWELTDRELEPSLRFNLFWNLRDIKRERRQAARAGQAKLVKWGDGDCPHRTMADPDSDRDISLQKRRQCGLCVAELKQELGVENG